MRRQSRITALAEIHGAFQASFMLRERYPPTWVWLDLIVSPTHLAYDGVIWQRPNTKLAWPS